MEKNEFLNYFGRKVEFYCCGNSHYGIIIGYDTDDKSYIIAIPDNTLEDLCPLTDALHHCKPYKIFYTQANKYKSCEYTYEYLDDLNFITKFYPNTKIFQKLYPEGREENGFWRVE